MLQLHLSYQQYLLPTKVRLIWVVLRYDSSDIVVLVIVNHLVNLVFPNLLIKNGETHNFFLSKYKLIYD